MSKNSLILVLQNKQENPTIDMAKIQIKSEKLTPFGGIFSIMEQFDALLAQIIDSTLGLRCTLFDYQYREILRSQIDIWEGEYTYRCILTNDYKSSARDIVEFYNLRGGKDYLKSLYGVRGFCVYDVSVMQGILQ